MPNCRIPNDRIDIWRSTPLALRQRCLVAGLLLPGLSTTRHTPRLLSCTSSAIISGNAAAFQGPSTLPHSA